ncbi:HAD domain-containing protein [Streptomyces antibioticus]|uniref:HAD domain-containing protein n=1 Tax=Streptomyces antibioticus TaxID=1890 RepID=UPI002256CF0F|nr:HAD domain-containing protein [Streptomyces antibioticus]MCX4738279.1 HAD domain-containing protein [Streptomyces antibioticus]
MTSVLLFLDIDGTLIPFGGPGPHPVYGTSPHPLLPRLDPALGPRLRALGAELVWATTWLDDANDLLSPWLGLPALPVVRWPDGDDDEGDEGADEPHGVGLHWKTRPLVEWAAGRPFVWVDDEISGADRAWVADRHPGPALLYRVDHRLGLADADLAAVGEWIGRQGEAQCPGDPVA